ncbi:MAG: phenylalanine--tRNA ligase subunit beta, partial [Acidimicrobiales bacterium]
LADVVVRQTMTPPRGLHPTRAAELVDRASRAVLGFVGEVDGALLDAVSSAPANHRVGVIDLDLDVLADHQLARRRDEISMIPSRYPSAVIDLAFVTPRAVHAADLAHELRGASELVEVVELFDVYEGASLLEGTRSLAYSVRLSSQERTLNESEVASARVHLIAAAESLGAVLR